MNEFNAIWEIEERLSTLPRGYISQKRIGGKTRYYLQWKENGKVKSQYIPLELLEETKAQIEERRRLQEQMKEWKVKNGKERLFETNVVICDELDAMIRSVYGLKKCEMYDRILSYQAQPAMCF